VTDTDFIRARLEAAGAFQNLFLAHTHEKLRKLLRMTEALSPRYHVVVANPPYMGSRSQPPELKRYLKDQYEDYKSDLFSAFVVRNLDMTLPQGQLGLMTPFVWMFISSYEDLRRYLIDHKTITSLVQLEYSGFAGATVPICTFTLENSHNPEYEGGYVRLSDFRGSDNQAPKTREAIANPDCGWFYRASGTDFKKIPGAPIAYWVSDQMREIFDEGTPIERLTISDGQTKTGNNSKYLRQHWEVNAVDVGEGKRWWRHPKGGPFRKWFGNVDWVIDWSEKTRKHYRKDRVARILPEYLWGRSGLLWTLITSAQQSFRLLEKGQIFNLAAPALFFKDEQFLKPCLGLLNTKLVAVLLDLMNPTLNMNVGEVRSIPYLKEKIASQYEAIVHTVNSCISISQSDWDSYETSWDFTTLPLLDARAAAPAAKPLPAAYLDLRARWRAMTAEMQRLEGENNRIFIEAYGLEDELSPDVPLSEITLTCNPHYRYGSSGLKTRNWANLCERFPATCERLAAIALELSPETPEEDRLGLEQRLLEDTMKEFISYAVGCMFGRYSLDKPGLVLANQGESVDSYQLSVARYQLSEEQQTLTTAHRPLTTDNRPQTTDHRPQTTDHRPLTTGNCPLTIAPVEDNVIPILDGDWFAGDITARFKRFLRVTFGEAHYEENLAFIELALNRSIRGYFLRNFYKDHIRAYSKRPIYWLFSSPNGNFNALIYMHRYRPDTASIVLNDYLRDYRAKLAARKAHLEYLERSADTPARDKTQAVKEIARIDKVLHELHDYEKHTLFPLAAQQVALDLDDGVLVNYNKLGAALAKVRGLSGKA
jgi:hypothetical protein